jgi:hypothetical protein
MRIGSEAPGGGPILQCGLIAIGRFGSPPPRIVIVSPSENDQRAAKSSLERAVPGGLLKPWDA